MENVVSLSAILDLYLYYYPEKPGPEAFIGPELPCGQIFNQNDIRTKDSYCWILISSTHFFQ